MATHSGTPEKHVNNHMTPDNTPQASPLLVRTSSTRSEGSARHRVAHLRAALPPRSGSLPEVNQRTASLESQDSSLELEDSEVNNNQVLFYNSFSY